MELADTRRRLTLQAFEQQPITPMAPPVAPVGTMSPLQLPRVDVGALFADYSRGAQQAKAGLPTFTDKITLPFDFELTDPSGNFYSLPTGSTLLTRADGTKVLTSPNLYVEMQGTKVLARQAEIILGETIDSATFAKLSARFTDVQAELTQGTLVVDRAQQTAQLTADTARFDWTTGSVTLTGASATIAPDQSALTFTSGALSATIGDTSVQGSFGRTDIALTRSGGLLLNHVENAQVQVRSKDFNLDVDISTIDSVLARFTGISGLAQGARLELVPTDDSARVGLQVSTTVNGIPISLQVADAGSLDALVATYRGGMHLRVGDATGRGTITLSSGPLALKGSTIEVVTEDRAYDAKRMYTAFSRLSSTDRVLHLRTPWTGVFVEGAFMPGDAFAATLGLGWSTKHTSASAFAGLLPGTFTDIDVRQGQLSFAGIPLPNRIGVPTMPTAGLTLRHTANGARWSATGGVFAKGAYAGVGFANRDLSVTADALADGKTVMGRLSVGFDF